MKANIDLGLRDIFVKNTGYQLIAQFVSIGVGLITNVILSRYLGVERFGEFAYVFAFFYLFLAVNDLGIHSITMREMSGHSDKAGEILGSILVFKLILAIASTVVSWFVIMSIDFNLELRNALLVYSLILPLLALQLPSIVFHVLLKMEYLSAIGIFNRLLQFGFILGVVCLGRGVAAIVGACILSEVISLALIWIFSARFQKVRFQINLSWWKKILTPSIFLGFAQVFAALINRLDFIMIERMTDLTQVGLYSAAYRITSLTEALPLMIMATAFPVMTRLVHEDVPRLMNLYKKLCLGFILGGIVMAGALSLVAPYVIRIIFGSSFAPAASALSILIWASACMYISITDGNVLISLHKEKVSLVIQSIAVIINIVLNLFWIPKWGYIGAAYATLIAFGWIAFCTKVMALHYLKSLIVSKKV